MSSYAVFEMYYKHGEHRLQIFNSDVEMEEYCVEKIDD
jgi:hypothetical protein